MADPQQGIATTNVNASKQYLSNSKNTKAVTKEISTELAKQTELNLQRKLQENDLLVTKQQYLAVVEKISKRIDEIQVKEQKLLTIAERTKVVNNEVIKIKQKQFGLTSEEYKLMQQSQNKYQNEFQENVKLSQEFTDVLSQIPGMGTLLSDAQSYGMAVMRGVDFVGKLKNGIDLSTVSMKAFMGSFGIGLAIMGALAVATFTFQNMLKFNVGNISAIFGQTMAYIGNKWAIFEVKVAGALRVLSPMFQSVFGGVAKVVTTIVDVALEFGETFYSVLADVMGPMSELMDSGNSMGGVFDLISNVIKEMKPVLTVIAYILAGVAASVLFIWNAFSAVLGVINTIREAIKDMFSINMPSWLSSFLGFDTSGEKVLAKEAASMPLSAATTSQNVSNVNSQQSFTMNLTNPTKDTIDYATSSMKAAMIDLDKPNHMG